ncbi:MAG: GNAT family N-acetyltransferase [Candidatus Eremiobacter antarcticus]|nr:N-acetyltransferase [Candidatus Eremiobacteraeota bacterium]MBC5808726.1 N-acetyltransferase [Candidatus Eremiobacteraeota bacterium]PZR62200.1 MAG: GNAT family N-acetyltransferase [Candidatus Eremiobacter sp. RRmetagenome_bin22]
MARTPKQAAPKPPEAAAVRSAGADDLEAIRAIYNEGIEDGIATLDYDVKTHAQMRDWFEQRSTRYPVIVACRDGQVVGWASLNPYSHRCAYNGVADLSIYVRRDARGQGVGTELMAEIEELARAKDFHKIVLHALTDNPAGRRLYEKRDFRDVGVFKEQGRLDGRFVDVIAMEKILAAG